MHSRGTERIKTDVPGLGLVTALFLPAANLDRACKAARTMPSVQVYTLPLCYLNSLRPELNGYVIKGSMVC